MTDLVEMLRGLATLPDCDREAEWLDKAADEIEKLRKQVRIVTLDYLAADGQAADLIEENTKLREALEAAADRMFDAGLNDAWAEARAALEGK